MPHRRCVIWTCGLGAALMAGARPARAQISLADDIIIAAQGEESKQRAKKSELGRAPGATSPLFGSVSATPSVLNPDPGRPHREFLRRTSRAPADALSQRLAQDSRNAPPEMRVPQLELPPPLPELDDSAPGVSDLLREDPGPPGALTLDQALARLVIANNGLRTKFHELPMAEADVLSASLRENPLLFYDTSQIPYGSYGARRPGSVDQGLSVVYPLDLSGKRKAKMTAARAAKRVREAQYQDAVRIEIDNLYSAFIDVLDSRAKVREARESLNSLERLMQLARSRGGEEDVESLEIERGTSAIHVEDEQARLARAKQVLAELLALPPDAASRLELFGTMRVAAPPLPPQEALLQIALDRRPDVVAHRLGLPHALAELERARSERMPNAYFLYTPFGYMDRRGPGALDSRTWGLGVFVSVPLYDRNQGNIRRSQVNVGRTQAELTTVERQVITEVRAALGEYNVTRQNLERLEREILPLIQKKRSQALRRFRDKRIDVSEYLSAVNQHGGTIRHYHDLRVRHRRSMLDLNTAVGCRILP